MSDVMKETLDRRLGLLESLRDLAVAQGEVIASRDTDELLRLLARRETLTNELVADQPVFDEAAAAWKAAGRTEDATLTTQLDRAEALLEEILMLDARDEVSIREACGKITDDIKEVTTQTVAHNTYNARTQAESARYTDASG